MLKPDDGPTPELLLLDRLETAADGSRALLASLEAQASELAARRADLEARRIAAASRGPLDPPPEGEDLETLDAELTAAGGMANATAAKIAAERATLATAEGAAARIRATLALAHACEARAEGLAAVGRAWANLGQAAQELQATASAVNGQDLAPYSADGGRARYWQALTLTGPGHLTPARQNLLYRLISEAGGAAVELQQNAATLAALPAQELAAQRQDLAAYPSKG